MKNVINQQVSKISIYLFVVMALFAISMFWQARSVFAGSWNGCCGAPGTNCSGACAGAQSYSCTTQPVGTSCPYGKACYCTWANCNCSTWLDWSSCATDGSICDQYRYCSGSSCMEIRQCGAYPNCTPPPPQPSSPTCSGVTFPSCITPGTSFTVTANGVNNATQVKFSTWSSANGQDDIVWYTSNGAPWQVSIPQSSHTGGDINVHVYMDNGSYTNVWCGGTSIPPCCTPVNGGWSAWSAKNTACGYSGTQTRTCTNPSPNSCGAGCSGSSTQSYTNAQCLPTAWCTVPNQPYGGNPGITLYSTNGYYCHVYHDWSEVRSGYFGSGTYYPGAQTSPGTHTAEVYCYNSDWVGSGWNYCSYTVPNAPVPGGWCGWSAKNTVCGYSGTQTRTCSCPSPAYGGAYCSGSSTQSYTNAQCLPTAWCTVAPVSCGGSPVITLHSTNGYYCYIYNDWSNCNTGYFGSGTTCSPGAQTPGAHQAQVYCYNSDWAGSGWNTCNYTVPPVAVNGGWTLFGACSKTCGTGTQTRTCTNPSPNSCGTGCSGLDGGNSSRDCNTQACIPAWWQVKDGDVTTNGNLQSKVPTTAIPPYFELPGGGGFPGIPSYNTTGTATFTPGGVSANGWLAASSYTSTKIYNSSYFLNEVPSDASVTTISSPSAPATTFTSGGTLKYGYYWYEYDGTNEFNINSDITAANLGTRKVILIIKNANFRITNKINLDDGSGFFMAVVGGNIIVGSGVGGGGSANLEGIYIADGQFQTGTTGSETDSQLWIRGTVAAYGGITLQRRLGDILNKTIPAELFEFAPDQDILFPSVLGRTVSNWQEVAP